MKIKVWPGPYVVAELVNAPTTREIVGYLKKFLSFTITHEEISLVCRLDELGKIRHLVIEAETGWRVVSLTKKLPLNLVGVIAKITTALARQNISVFVISTYNTDYILIKNSKLKRAVDILKKIKLN